MTIKEINTEGVDSVTATQFIKSYEILKSEGCAEIEDDLNIHKNMCNALVGLRVIKYDFIIKDIVKLKGNNAYTYILYIEIIVPYKTNPGSIDTTREVSQYIALGYAKLNMVYSGFIVKPKIGVDKIRASFNKFFQKDLFKDNKNDRLFYDNYLIQGDQAAFECFASSEAKKELFHIKNFNLFVKDDILIVGTLQDFKIENVIALNDFFKTIQGSLC